MSDVKGVHKRSLYSCAEDDPALFVVLIRALFDKLDVREVTFNRAELVGYSNVDADVVMDLFHDGDADTLMLKANDWVSEENST